MPQSRSQYIECKGRVVHYTEWGWEHSETIVMWHGLARTGRDFDPIARELSDTYRVICPDTIGRGLSQWAEDPEQEYCLEFYGEIVAELLNGLGLEKVRWVGSSMGGAIGLKIAGGALRDRITHLVLNDIGPELPIEAVQRITTYVSQPPVFATMPELEQYVRTVLKPFGVLSDAQWRHLAETTCRRRDDGRITLHYDPRITQQFQRPVNDYNLWDDYDRVAAKTLVVRGALSDLLTPEIFEKMQHRGPHPRVMVVPDAGHVPQFVTEAEQHELRTFFSS